MKKIFFILYFFHFSCSAQYNSLLWKISGNGLKQPSYLFGTMHASDARIIAKGNSVLKYFSEAKTYAMELDPAEAFDMGVLAKLAMPEGKSLQKMIPEKKYQFLDSVLISNSGFPLYLFDNIAPVFVMTIFETVSMGLKDTSSSNTDVLDMYFYNKAKAQKKKVIGIETADEQLAALNTLSYEEQAQLLVKTVDELSSNEKEGSELLKFYLQENLDSVASLGADETLPEKFERAMIENRNHRMAERISFFIQNKSAFIALGALHLPGKEGVIELLRQKGFSVEAQK